MGLKKQEEKKQAPKPENIAPSGMNLSEITGCAEFYQQFCANFDPDYASYFSKQASQNPNDAMSMLQQAHSEYNTFYNGYLASGYTPPNQDQTQKDAKAKK
jgi:hypothetical protein